MPDRISLVSTLRYRLSLALLASLLAAPIPTSGFVTIPSRPDCSIRSFVLPAGQPTTRLSAALATNGVLQENALFCDDEEQDPAVALDEPRVAFLAPCSYRKLSDLQLIAPPSILSLYPLRC